MGKVGLPELIILALPVLGSYALVFFFGFVVGKSAGFKECWRQFRGANAPAQRPR